ncbi:MAG TPA: prolipoprotein diacylglyceryl transferase [Anaerolineales bacterium]|nr:prolipoprotein diacylglyceryl transferase [Anaerolineales bacterium]
MYPTILIGSFKLSTHLVLNLLAAIAVGIFANYRALKRGYRSTVNEVINLVFYLALGVLGGAYLGLFIPYATNHLAGNPAPAQWWLSGQNWFGAVTGGSLAGLLYCKHNHRPVGWSFDLFAPLLPLALAIVRIGCQLAGDSYGKLTSTWLAMRLPDDHGLWANRYPTQIVDTLINLLILFALLSFERWTIQSGKGRGWPFEGFLFWLYVLLFCGQRLYFEAWRGDTPILFGTWTWNHLYSLLGFMAALVGIAWELRRASTLKPT